MTHLLIESLRNSIFITGLVVVMMMMIESVNIESRGLLFKGLKKTKKGQVVFSALLGSVPGCMGGFAVVSMYTHRMMSFGALVAMLIASSGDEAFTMLAMFPEDALKLFAILFVLAIVVGFITDAVFDKMHKSHCRKEEHDECGIDNGCFEGYVVHETADDKEDESGHVHKRKYFGWRRAVMLLGLSLFIGALATGHLGHDHSTHSHGHESDVHVCNHSDNHTHEHGHIHTEESHQHAGHLDILSEDWMNLMFSGLSVILLLVLILGSDHFINEHLWKHIIKKHLFVIFAWTFGTLLIMGMMMQSMDIGNWISNNTALMIVLAAIIGMIPQSGPHMIFIVLFAQGSISFPVLLASSISQDGHASIPLLAESKWSFAIAKLLNVIIAIAAGYAAMLFF